MDKGEEILSLGYSRIIVNKSIDKIYNIRYYLNCKDHCKRSFFHKGDKDMNSAASLRLNILYIGRFVSTIGDWLYIVALSIILSKNNSVELTFLWLIRSLAPLLMLPIAGSIADRINKKALALMVEIVRGLTVILMPFFLESNILFLLIFLTSFFGPLFSAALNPMITSFTNEDNRHRVNSILTTINAAAFSIGPLLGGLLIIKNDAFPFLLQAITFFISGLLFLFITSPKIEQAASDEKKKLSILWNDSLFSIKYILKNRLILWITITETIFLLGGAAFDAYEVLFLTKALHMNETGYALMVSISGFAFVVAGLINTMLNKRISPTSLFFGGIFLSGIGNIIYAFSFYPWTVYIALFLTALGVITFNTSMVTIFQSIIPVQLQGRIISFQHMLPTIASTISVVLAGIVIPVFTIRVIFIGLAIISMIGTITALPVLKELAYIKEKVGGEKLEMLS